MILILIQNLKKFDVKWNNLQILIFRNLNWVN